jgi:hypothetical protein
MKVISNSIQVTNFNSDDQAKLLRVLMNDMKKKLQFVEKTDWMFKNKFNVKFLET